LLHQVVPGLDRLTGLQDGAHYISWGDLQDLQEKIRYWLQPRREEKRAQIAREGRDYVRANHSFQNRVDELLKLLERIGEKVA